MALCSECLQRETGLPILFTFILNVSMVDSMYFRSSVLGEGLIFVGPVGSSMPDITFV